MKDNNPRIRLRPTDMAAFDFPLFLVVVCDEARREFFFVRRRLTFVLIVVVLACFLNYSGVILHLGWNVSSSCMQCFPRCYDDHTLQLNCLMDMARSIIQFFGKRPSVNHFRLYE